MRNCLKILLFGCVLLIFLNSCQPIFRLVTGVKNPKPYTSLQDRSDYYQKMGSKSSVLVTHTIAKKEDYIRVFQIVSSTSFPLLLMKDLKSEKVYSLDCYDDIDYTIELIKTQKLDSLSIASEVNTNVVDSLVKYSTTDHTFENSQNKEEDFDFVLVNGLFFGKKLRKRMIKLFDNVENVRKIEVYELSLDEKLEKSYGTQ